jgi:uncharacterized protein YkwD
MHMPGRRQRIRGLCVAALLALATVIGAACGPAPGPASSAANDLRARTDYYRGLNGRAALEFDTYLEGNAQLHADRLAAGATDCNNMWHSGEMNDWYGGYAWAENVACVWGCPADAASVFDIWLASPWHNANMLSPAYARTGVGVTCSGSVQMIVAHYRSP